MKEGHGIEDREKSMHASVPASYHILFRLKRVQLSRRDQQVPLFFGFAKHGRSAPVQLRDAARKQTALVGIDRIHALALRALGPDARVIENVLVLVRRNAPRGRTEPPLPVFVHVARAIVVAIDDRHAAIGGARGRRLRRVQNHVGLSLDGELDWQILGRAHVRGEVRILDDLRHETVAAQPLEFGGDDLQEGVALARLLRAANSRITHEIFFQIHKRGRKYNSDRICSIVYSIRTVSSQMAIENRICLPNA